MSGSLSQKSTMFELYAICICTAIVTFFFLPRLGRRLFRSSPYADITSIHSFLHPPGTTINELLCSRSEANARLVDAFHLTNTFVSPDPTIHKSFVKHSHRLLRAANERGWPHFRDICRQAVDASLPESSFSTFIQGATLRAIIVGFLAAEDNINMASLHSSDVNIVTALISKLLSLSKGPQPVQPALLNTLNHHLRRLLSDRDAHPNPLNHVIPAWEMMWRVVAVTVARAHNSEDGRRIFARFAENPIVSQFRESVGAASVEGWICETLRLHPPVKRIARRVTAPWEWLFGFWGIGRYMAVADIEKAQRSPAEWGETAEVYDPSRHAEEGHSRALLAFGHGPLGCVAGDWAPKAAAVLVAAILARLDGTEYGVAAGREIGGRVGWEDWTITNNNY
ncbi:hypothetical protein C8J57DRAFT_1320553 [Mycena rebaudengoi]|nr:hypothetical protein C8J57DRAFT_1320553 [Mycena rebaudengoi]